MNCGLNFNNKNARIKGYMHYYKILLEKGSLVGYSNEDREKEVDKVMSNIKGNKKYHIYLNMNERLAMAISAKYISTLNDSEFLQLLQDTNIIDEDKKKSLTRKYREIEDLQNDTYIQEKWKTIQKVQKDAAEITK